MFNLRALFHKNRAEREMDDELSFHLEKQIEQNIAQGMTPEEARYAALRQFGNLGAVKEDCRDSWGVRIINELTQDIHYGLRQLRRNPGFTIVAVITLALGIGANTAIFSLVDAMFLRPLPVAHSDQLMRIYTKTPQGLDSTISYPDYLDLKKQASGFSGFLVWDRGAAFVNSMERSSQILVDRVSPDYFTTLGVTAFRGRMFLPQLDSDSKGERSIVVSYRVWKNRLGADPDIVGKTIKVTGKNAVVLGIAPPGFLGVDRMPPTDAWLLISESLPDMIGQRRIRGFEAMGRLKKGTTFSQARAQLDAIGDRLAAAYPATNKATKFVLAPENRTFIQEILLSLVSLSFPVLVLLIACANVAGLLLARGETRRHELAMRMALGAGRFRVARQLLTEGGLLSIMGAALGLLLTAWLIEAEPALIPPGPIPISPVLRLDARILFFTVLLCIAATLIFSLAPALQGLKMQPLPVLKGDFDGQKRGRRFSFRTALITGQIAISVVMLTGAMLLFRSLEYTLHLPLGFDIRKNLLIVDLFPSGGFHPQAATFLPGLAEKLEGLPAVEHVSCARRILLSWAGGGMNLPVSIPGVALPQGQSSIPIKFNSVSPEYFATVGTRILAGRAFRVSDGPNAHKVAIVSEMMAKRFWPNGNAVGHSFDVAGTNYQIIGIAENAKINNVHEPYEPYIYLPFAQSPVAGGSLILETKGNPDALIGPVRAEVQKTNSAIVISGLESSKELLSGATWGEGMFTKIGGALSLLGIFLAAVGLYGVISFVVKRRTHEIGIRMALGARSRDVLLATLRQGLRLAIIGTALGVILALATTRLMASVLHGVSPYDPWSLLGAVLGVLAVSLLACYIPARRAAKVDPMVALRYE